jgi:hypothetical protein
MMNLPESRVRRGEAWFSLPRSGNAASRRKFSSKIHDLVQFPMRSSGRKKLPTLGANITINH